MMDTGAREERESDPQTVGGGDGFGARLRAARQARGLDLVEIADELKIRRCYLQALEEGDVESLPARPFAIGFLRSYARLLDLDGNALVKELKLRLDGGGRLDAVAAARTAGPDGAVLSTAAEGTGGNEAGADGPAKDAQATLFGMVLFVIGALGIGAMATPFGGTREIVPVASHAAIGAQADPFARPSSRPPAAMDAAVPQAARIAAVRGAAAPSGRHDEGGRSARLPPAGASDAATVPPSADRATGHEAEASLVSASAAVAPRTGTRPRTSTPPVRPSPSMKKHAAPILFRARHDAWAMVEDGRGRPIWSGIIPAGSEWVPPAGARRFTTTHPASLVLVVEGEEWGTLGRGAVPVQDLPLDAAGLRHRLETAADERRLTLSVSSDTSS